MIKQFPFIAKTSKDATLVIAGILVFVWAFEKLNPNSLIVDAEGRQKIYVNERIAEKEKLDSQRHEEQMKAVARIDKSIHELNQKIDRIIEFRASNFKHQETKNN